MLQETKATIDRGALFRDVAAVERVVKSAVREATRNDRPARKATTSTTAAKKKPTPKRKVAGNSTRPPKSSRR